MRDQKGVAGRTQACHGETAGSRQSCPDAQTAEKWFCGYPPYKPASVRVNCRDISIASVQL